VYPAVPYPAVPFPPYPAVPFPPYPAVPFPAVPAVPSGDESRHRVSCRAVPTPSGDQSVTMHPAAPPCTVR
jgi:hypothetical protein